jgi:hypothetical protein
MAGQRVYLPATSRWLSRDPAGENGGVNLYQYAFANPVNLVDSDGEAPSEWADTIDGWIDYARDYWATEDNHWVVNGTIGSIADIVKMPVDVLRFGDGIGQAVYDPCATGFDRAMLVVTDIGRGAVIFEGAGNVIGKGACMLRLKNTCFVAGTAIATDEGQRPIESLRVGDRVLTPSGESSTMVDPTTWRKVALRVQNAECPWDSIDVEVLRSVEWLSDNGARPGEQIWLEFEELDVRGRAEVLSISSCPSIKPGKGRVVLATVTHFNTFVMNLKVAGQKEPLHPTDRHRLFSVTRNDWVSALELKPGEELRTTTGIVQIDSVDAWPGTHRVFNIEVETEHSYFAGTAQVLAHNAYIRDFATPRTKNWSATMKSERDARALARTKIGKNPVQVEPNKWRSADGRWQYRAKPGDLADRHIHIEQLNPQTGEVIQNAHLRW